MKLTTLRTLIVAAALVLLAAWPAHAQRLLTYTTLAANVAQADDTISVTSSTGFTVGQLVLIDYEVMRIQSLNGVAGTSTLISVQRAVDGTQRRAHDNTAGILVTQINTDFKQIDPAWGADCTDGAGEAAVLPWVNSATGVKWDCQGGSWRGMTPMPITDDSDYAR